MQSVFDILYRQPAPVALEPVQTVLQNNSWRPHSAFI